MENCWAIVKVFFAAFTTVDEIKAALADMFSEDPEDDYIQFELLEIHETLKDQLPYCVIRLETEDMEDIDVRLYNFMQAKELKALDYLLLDEQE